MELYFENLLEANITGVANEFIDRFMAEANGEYVKVYLYLLRHRAEVVTVGTIADALNHTEADVRRALGYWRKAGVLKLPEAAGEQKKQKPGTNANVDGEALGRVTASQGDPVPRVGYASQGEPVPRVGTAMQSGFTAQADAPPQAGQQAEQSERAHCTEKEIEKLSGQEEFAQLLYIAQKYMNKTFTPVDCEVFAYLYGTLRMPTELLEYLVEYCAQNNHTSIRYVEKVALDWHARKLLTVEQAQAYAQGFSKDSFAVMKAFGLTGRNPGQKESEDIERWFKTYGFTKEIVTAACNRTMEAIHTPSFQYTEQILREWKKAGVRTAGDIEVLDKQRLEQKKQKPKDGAVRAQAGRRGQAANRFHNLEEHGYDYDEMVWSMINSGQSES